MANDYKKLSRKQLEKHLKDINAALKTLEAREKREARKAAEKAAAKFGFSLAELSGTVAAKTTAPRKTAKAGSPKFRNPENTSQTWTGKGRQPVWYKDAIAAGKTPEDLAI